MNKQFLKVGLVTLMAGIYSSGASADVATGTATAEIVSPVQLTLATAMDFGTFAPDAAGDTVTLDAALAHNRAITTGSLVNSPTVASGAYTLSGAALAVDVAIADGTADLTNGGNTLGFTPTAPADITNGYVIGTGTDTIYVGGTLTIPAVASAPAGTYTSAAAYTITVNYQ
ncbi:DUF4402 domain-containing protein [Pseudomonadota bacterium]